MTIGRVHDPEVVRAEALQRSGLSPGEYDQIHAELAATSERHERVKAAIHAVDLGRKRSADDIQADLLASYAAQGIDAPKQSDLRHTAEMLSIQSGPRLTRLPRMVRYCFHWLAGYPRGDHPLHNALMTCAVSIAVSLALLAADLCAFAFVGQVVGIVLGFLWLLSAGLTVIILSATKGLAYTERLLSDLDRPYNYPPRDEVRHRRLLQHRRHKRKVRKARH